MGYSAWGRKGLDVTEHARSSSRAGPQQGVHRRRQHNSQARIRELRRLRSSLHSVPSIWENLASHAIP